MLYKNSLKLIFSNFHLVWKMFLYLLIAGVVVCGFGYLSSIPIINLLADNNWFDLIKESYNSFISSFNFNDLFSSVATIFDNFTSIIMNNFSKIWFNVVLFIFIVTIFGGFIRGMYLLPTCNNLYYYMTSTAKQSFTASFLETFKQNLKYSLAYLITLLPIRLLSISLIFKIIVWFGRLGGGYLILLPFVALICYIVLTSLRVTLFCGWVPSLITLNSRTFPGIKEGFLTAKRRFSKVFSNSIGLTLSILFINVFAFFLTFGVGLLITIPLSYVWFATFDMSSFFTSYGMKFYVDPYNFIAPKKREQAESVISLKYLV